MSSDSEQDKVDLEEEEIESDESNAEESEIASNDEESENESKDSTPVLTSNEDKIRNKISERYKKRQGKEIYIRFPARLPEDETEFQKKAKALSTLIVEAHKPRQKHARFCLVNFKTKSDRDQALKDIRTSAKKDKTFKGIVASIPRTESEEFVQGLIKKKIETVNAKKAKARLKKAAKLAKRKKEYTSMVVVHNLPGNVSMIEMKKLFPNAIDIQLRSKGEGGKKSKRSIATVTLPSSFDARKAVQKRLLFGGTELKIRFDISRRRPETTNETNVQQDNEVEQIEDTN